MTNLKSDLQNLPIFPNWITVKSAAKRLGVSTNAIYWRINNGDFRDVYRLGEPEQERFVILLHEEEVAELAATMKAAAQRSQTDTFTYQVLQQQWNRRVKEWARSEPALFEQINAFGRPGQAMCDAYLRAHPDDPRPVKPERSE